MMLLGASLLGFLPGLLLLLLAPALPRPQVLHLRQGQAASDRPRTARTPRWPTVPGTSTRSPARPSGPSSWAWARSRSVLALVFGSWLAFLGIPLILTALVGVTAESRRGGTSDPPRPHASGPPQAGRERGDRRCPATERTRCRARWSSLIAVATGAIVANLYYAQPLLHQVAETFHRGPGPTSWSSRHAGRLRGRVVARRAARRPAPAPDARACGSSASPPPRWWAPPSRPSLWFFALASLAVGAASVAGQVMIPFAADLAPEERRGRVVARIMTGLLLGILLARTVSGFVAQATGGWRASTGSRPG